MVVCHQVGFGHKRSLKKTPHSGRWLTDIHDEDINVTIACAILVTSAPIFTLKEGLSLDDVYQAKSLDSLVTEHESVILWDSNAPDRANYSMNYLESLMQKHYAQESNSTALYSNPRKG